MLPASAPASDPEEDDPLYLALSTSPEQYAGCDFNDPDIFAHEVEGDLVLCDSSGTPKHTNGGFRCFQVDVDGAVAQAVSVFDVFDTRPEIFPYYEALYDGKWEFSRGVLKTLRCEDEFVLSGLLILDRLFIDPLYRGRGFALEALRCMIQRYRMGAGVIAMKPFPLQFEAGMRSLDAEKLRAAGLSLPGTQKEATAKLRAYYRRLGFKVIPKTPFMAVSTVYSLDGRLRVESTTSPLNAPKF